MGLTRPRYSSIVDTDFKQFVTVVTTTNITLTGGAPATYDGYTFSAGDRVLVNGQNAGSQNGIYVVTTPGSGSNGTWNRSSDANSATVLVPGTSVPVTRGTYAGSTWKLTTPAPYVVGTTALTFVSGSTAAGGISGQVQYNLSGIAVGAANVSINSNGNLNVTSNVVLSGDIWQGNRAGHGVAYTVQSATPPANPLYGDQWYDTSVDVLYEWFTDGTSSFWKDTSSASYVIGYTVTSGTPPTAPRPGDQWYDTSTDILYEYVNNGTTSFWVDYTTRVELNPVIGGFLTPNNLVKGLNTTQLVSATPGTDYLVPNTNVSLTSLTVYRSADKSFTTPSLNLDMTSGGTYSSIAFTQAGAVIAGIRAESNFLSFQNGGGGFAFQNGTAVSNLLTFTTASGNRFLSANIELGAIADTSAPLNIGRKSTDPTSTTTGTVVVVGGLGMSGAANIGGNVTSGGSINVSGVANITGNLNVLSSGLFQGAYDENSAIPGVFVGNTGSGTPSPRMGFFNGVTAQNWQIDNYGGQFRWFTPGVTRMSLDAIGNLTNYANASISGNVTASGNAGIIQPNRTAFRVYGNGGSVGLNANLTSSVWTLDWQQGFASTALNTSTGIFTAPIAGLYSTSLTARTTANNNTQIIQAAIQKQLAAGGSVTVQAFIEWGPNTSFDHASTSTTVKLAVGDKIWVQCLASGGSASGFSFDGNDHWDVVYLG